MSPGPVADGSIIPRRAVHAPAREIEASIRTSEPMSSAVLQSTTVASPERIVVQIQDEQDTVTQHEGSDLSPPAAHSTAAARGTLSPHDLDRARVWLMTLDAPWSQDNEGREQRSGLGPRVRMPMTTEWLPAHTSSEKERTGDLQRVSAVESDTKLRFLPSPWAPLFVNAAESAAVSCAGEIDGDRSVRSDEIAEHDSGGHCGDDRLTTAACMECKCLVVVLCGFWYGLAACADCFSCVLP